MDRAKKRSNGSWLQGKVVCVGKNLCQVIDCCSVEMQGVLSIKKLPELDAKARYIFVVPPNLEDLKQRLIDRGETTESVERRLKATQWEIETAEKNSTHEEIVQTNYLVELFDATIVTDIPEIAYQDFKKAVFEPFTKITS